MNRKIIIIGLVVVVAIIGVWFLTNSSVTSPASTASKQEAIKIGIMLPYTSDYAFIAEGIDKAAEMALADFKAINPDISVVTVKDDDKFDAKTGVGIYTKLVSVDKVDAIFMVSTPVIDAAHEKMKQDGLPIVSVGLQNYGVGKDNIFQMTADANRQIEKLAEYMNEKSNHTKVVLVHSSNAPALVGFYNAFTSTYQKNRSDFIINSKDDAKTVAAKVAGSGADAIVVLTDPANGSAITKELLLLGVTTDKVQYYFDAQLQTGWGEYVKQVGDMNRLNGTLLLQFTTSDLSDFSTRFKQLHGTDSSPFAEYGYDGIMTLLNNYATDKGEWVAKIENTDFKGYSGDVNFDERGVRDQGTEVWKVEAGKVVKN